MKESRYIELLNLYVDHQLTPVEAAELEAEVHRNPERRRIYTQYCQMQKACTLIFDAERSLAPKTAAVLSAFEAGRPVSSSSPFWGFGAFGTVGLAAAVAFGAFVGIRWYSGSTGPTFQPAPAMAAVANPAVPDLAPVSETVAQVEAVSGARGSVDVVVADVPVPAVSDEAVVLLASAASSPSQSPSASVSTSARSPFQSFLLGTTSMLSRVSDNEASRSPQVDLAWLNDVKLPAARPLLDDEPVFESQPTLKQGEPRIYRSRQPFRGGTTEMISFQFQR